MSAPSAPVEGQRAGDALSRQAAQQRADGDLARLGRPPAHPQSSASAPPRAGLVRASVEGQASTGIARHELALAAYLTARLIVGRPVDPEDIARLRKANDSVDETRQRLPLGRGNVIEDIDATDGDSMWRANAAHSYAYHLDRQHGVPPSDLPQQTLHQAVAATAFAAGRCGEYSPTAAVLHTSRLQPGESLHIVSDSSHQWTEARIGDDRDRAVVLDAWASGPPVLAPDGSHTGRPANSTVHYEPIPSGTAPPAAGKTWHDALDEGAASVQAELGDEGLRQWIDAQARPTARLVAAFDKMLGLDYWTEPQVLDSGFVAQAQGVAAQDTLSAEIAAARIAKQLGSTVETQRADVEAILQALAGFKA